MRRGSMAATGAMTVDARVALLACLLVAASGGVAAGPPLSDWMQGTANHFGGPAEGDPFNPLVPIGGCSYGELDPREFPHYDILSVAPDSELVAGKAMGGCGACYELQCADSVEKCNNGPFSNSVVAMIAGTCLAGCGDTQVNLHVFAFDQLAPIRLGNIQIRMRQVECKPKAPLVVKVKTYRVGEGGYIKFVFRNVPGDGGLTSVELKGTRETGSWRPAENLFGAAWEASQLPEAPLDLRLTNTLGEQVVLKSIIKSPGFIGEETSDEQFRQGARGANAPRPARNPTHPSYPAPPPLWSNDSTVVGPAAAPVPVPAPQPPYKGVSASILDVLRGFLVGSPEPGAPGQEEAGSTTVLQFPILTGR